MTTPPAGIPPGRIPPGRNGSRGASRLASRDLIPIRPRATAERLGLHIVVVLLLVSATLFVVAAGRDGRQERLAQTQAAALADDLAARCLDAGLTTWHLAMESFGPTLEAFGAHATFRDPVSHRLLFEIGNAEAAGVTATARIGDPLEWLSLTIQLNDQRSREWLWPLLVATMLACAMTILLSHRAARRAMVDATNVASTIDELAGGSLTPPRQIPTRQTPTRPTTHEVPAHRMAASGEFGPIAAALDRLVRQVGPQLSHLQNLSTEQQAILESMGSGLIAIDPDQRILSLNRAASLLLGIDAGRVRGRLVQEVTRQPGLNQFISEGISADGAIDAEFQMEHPERGRLLVQAVSEPLRDPGGRPAGLLIVLTDITTLRRLETLRADFAANVSHELRTPITNIKGYAETLLQVGFDDQEQATRFLEIIRRNAHRLATIIEDLLALTRLEQPGVRETLERTVLSANRLADAVVTHLAPTAEAKEIQLRNEVPESLKLFVMPTLIEQAVANLVSNAITYSPAGTTVRITARRPSAGWIELAIVDQGPGIPAHHLARIFERFYRVDKARSREQGGTGLGLAIVKHIALVHGGKVEVASRVGVGSTFRLLLPELPEAETAAPEQSGD